MWFRSLFDAWLARSPRAPVSRIHRVPRARPLLEILEDRTLLSTYTVDTLTDTGTGSGLTGDLRYCITNATSGGDTITFASGLTGTIQLESALPNLNSNVNIQGPGASLVTVKCDPAVPSFDAFTVGSAANVQLSGLTIIGSPSGAVGIVIAGIVNNGSANVSECTLSGNFVGFDNASSGKAIINYCTISGSSGDSGVLNDGALTINNSTISGNNIQGYPGFSNTYEGVAYSGGDIAGGGIYMDAGTLTINSSTVANNEVEGGNVTGTAIGRFDGAYGGNGYGGGLYIAGGAVSINNSTFADNQARGGFGLWPFASGSGYGGGIYNAAGPDALQMYDTVLADNSADSAGPDLDGSVTSQGHNLIGNTSGGSGFATSDLVNVNPQLGPLQNNGGPTQTMALLAGSPAIDAGDNTNAPAYDQRGPGFARIVNGTIDIGAFEVQSSSTQASSLAVTGFPSVITAGSPGNFTVTALNANGTTDTTYTGTIVLSSTDTTATFADASTGTQLTGNNYTFQPGDNGTHTFTAVLTKAGTQSITATDTSTGSITGSDTGITVTPAAASRLVFGQQPSTTTAGQSISPAVTVDVEDQYGNLVSNDSSTVTLTLSSGTFEGGSATTFAAASGGVATFGTLKIDKAGSYTLKATDASLTSASSGSFTVQPAAASRFILQAPSSVTAGKSFSLTVTVEDAYGNVAVGYTGTVHFSSTDKRAKLPQNYTFTASDKGVHTFTGLVLYTLGNQNITVTDTQNSSLTNRAVVDVLSGKKVPRPRIHEPLGGHGKNAVFPEELVSLQDFEFAIFPDLIAEHGSHPK